MIPGSPFVNGIPITIILLLRGVAQRYSNGLQNRDFEGSNPSTPVYQRSSVGIEQRISNPPVAGSSPAADVFLLKRPIKAESAADIHGVFGTSFFLL